MKNFLTLILLFFGLIGFSQSKTENVISVSKLKLAEAKLLSDVVTDIESDKVISIEVSGKVGGKVRVAKCSTNELSEDIKGIFKKVDAWTKIYIDVKTNVKDSKVQSFVLLASDK